jgi:hypothetical protein
MPMKLSIMSKSGFGFRPSPAAHAAELHSGQILGWSALHHYTNLHMAALRFDVELIGPAPPAANRGGGDIQYRRSVS